MQLRTFVYVITLLASRGRQRIISVGLFNGTFSQNNNKKSSWFKQLRENICVYV